MPEQNITHQSGTFDQALQPVHLPRSTNRLISALSSFSYDNSTMMFAIDGMEGGSSLRAFVVVAVVRSLLFSLLDKYYLLSCFNL